jgi:choline dehydrogenase-like flavoprotein
MKPEGNLTVSEKELAERIIAEAQRWTESQYTLQAGIPGNDSTSRNEAKARIELVEHIKTTYKEMRENA